MIRYCTDTIFYWNLIRCNTVPYDVTLDGMVQLSGLIVLQHMIPLHRQAFYPECHLDSNQIDPADSLLKAPPNHHQPLAAHKMPFRIFDRLIEGLMSGLEGLKISAEEHSAGFGHFNDAPQGIFHLMIYFEILKTLIPYFYITEKRVEPDDDGHGEMTGQGTKVIQGFNQIHATGDDSVNNDAVSLALKYFKGVVLFEIRAQRNETRGADVHHQVRFWRASVNVADQFIKATGINVVAFHEVERFDVQTLVPGQAGIDRIGITAGNLAALFGQVLVQNSGDQGFADAAFTLHNKIGYSH